MEYRLLPFVTSVASTGNDINLIKVVRIEFFQGTIDDFIKINDVIFPLGTYPVCIGDFEHEMDVNISLSDGVDNTIGVIYYRKITA